jgi:pullulanase/glycogen debranching enzyme
MFNASDEAAEFTLPHPSKGGHWHLAVDTFAQAPRDLFESGQETKVEDQEAYQVGPRTSVILVTQPYSAT